MLASTLLDLGSPSLPAVFSLWGSVLLTAYAMWRDRNREAIRWAAFVGAYGGAAAGCFIYVFGLITGLY